MSKRADKNLIVGLDIGTSKVVAIVGEVNDEGNIEVVGIGSHPSRGLKKGVVVNIESTVHSIQRAVEEAELMAGCDIHSVYTGIAGSHVRSLNSHGIVAIRDSEVSPGDVDRVIDAARAVAIPADQKILHILPQEFLIDNQEGIKEPVGMSGVRLEAKVHMVTGAVSAAQNIIKCVRRCGLEVERDPARTVRWRGDNTAGINCSAGKGLGIAGRRNVTIYHTFNLRYADHPERARTPMSVQTQQERELAELIIDCLNLEDIAPEEIDPEEPLFGDGLGLDSIDALEMALAISQKYGVQLRSEDEHVKETFSTLRTLNRFILDNSPAQTA